MYPKRQGKYAPLPKDEAEGAEPSFYRQRQRCSPASPTLYLSFVFTTCLVGILGFFGGRFGALVNPGPDHGGYLEPVGSVRRTLIYDRRFSSAPSEESEEAWMSLFPDGLGFVQHPELAPEASAVAVFHSLHCLHSIHGGYYKALTSHPGEQKDHGDFHGVSGSHEEHEDPSHLRHCFDYLRQSLMCGADTNIEPMNKELMGVTGWGYERTCRNYDAVFDWASKWKMGNTTDI